MRVTASLLARLSPCFECSSAFPTLLFLLPQHLMPHSQRKFRFGRNASAWSPFGRGLGSSYSPKSPWFGIPLVPASPLMWSNSCSAPPVGSAPDFPVFRIDSPTFPSYGSLLPSFLVAWSPLKHHFFFLHLFLFCNRNPPPKNLPKQAVDLTPFIDSPPRIFPLLRRCSQFLEFFFLQRARANSMSLPSISHVITFLQDFRCFLPPLPWP